jgi:hypothetical protein
LLAQRLSRRGISEYPIVIEIVIILFWFNVLGAGLQDFKMIPAMLQSCKPDPGSDPSLLFQTGKPASAPSLLLVGDETLASRLDLHILSPSKMSPSRSSVTPFRWPS